MPQALSCIVVENKRVSSLGYPTNYILSAINLPEVSISSSFFYSQIPQRHDRLILETFRITGIVGMNTFVIRIHK